MQQDGSWEQKRTSTNSLCVAKHMVNYVLEYALNKMILALESSYMLIVNDWHKVIKISQ